MQDYERFTLMTHEICHASEKLCAYGMISLNKTKRFNSVNMSGHD